MNFFNPLFSGSFALLMLIGLAALVFNIWMLVDVVRRPETDFNPPSSRVWWIVGLAVGLLLGWVGLAVSLVYFFAVRRPLLEGKGAVPLFGAGPRAVGGAPGRSCPNCDAPLGTHARYCQNCGTPIGED